MTGGFGRAKAKWRSAVPGRPKTSARGAEDISYDAWVARSVLPETRGWVPCIDRGLRVWARQSGGSCWSEARCSLGPMRHTIAHV